MNDIPKISGYIIDTDGYKEFLELYNQIVREFGVCILTVGKKEFRDVLLFKSYIEESLAKKQYYWCCVFSAE